MDAAILVVLLGCCVLAALLAGGGYYVWSRRGTTPGAQVPAASPSAEKAPPVSNSAPESLTTFGEDAVVQLSKNGAPVRLAFFPTKSNKCIASTTGSAPVGKWMVSSFNGGKAIKPNCDRDAKHTSHLMDLPPDPVHPKATALKQPDKATWVLDCSKEGCAISLKKNAKRFLDVGSDGRLIVSTTRTLWSLTSA